MKIRNGLKVKLRTFNNLKSPLKKVSNSENYWVLIGKTGRIVKDPNEEKLHASFSTQKRFLIQFNDNLKKLGLEAHNNVENSLWILLSDLVEEKGT